MANDDQLDELLDEIESHGDLDKAEQHLSIRVEERRYGKAMTIIEGFTVSASDVDAIASELKSSLGTGGTTTEDTIELQGDHRDRVPKLLEEQGYETGSGSH